MTIKAMGLDLSCTSTGLVGLLSGEDYPYNSSHFICVERLIKASRDATSSLDRAMALSDEVLEVAQTFAPDIVCIEGYSHSSKWSQALTVELGTVVRLVLHISGYQWTEIPPSSLKKFVAGKGNSSKSVMISEVYKRWGYDTKSDDMADAYGLACMGLAIKGTLFGMTKFQSEAIHALTL